MSTPEIVALCEEDEREFLEAMDVGELEPLESPTLAETDARLDWLLERIAKRRHQVAENDAVAKKRLLQIEDWRQGENAKLERSIDWFQSQLRQLVPVDAQAFEGAYGQRSRRLPFGSFGYKKHPPKVEITDDERALAWAKANGCEIKVKETVSKTVLRAELEAGKVGDGFELITSYDEFYVKTEGA